MVPRKQRPPWRSSLSFERPSSRSESSRRHTGDAKTEALQDGTPLQSAIRDALSAANIAAGTVSLSSSSAEALLHGTAMQPEAGLSVLARTQQRCAALSAEVKALQEQLAARELEQRNLLRSDVARAPDTPVRERIAVLEAAVEAKDATISRLEAEAGSRTHAHEMQLGQLLESCHAKVKSLRVAHSQQLERQASAARVEELSLRRHVADLQQQLSRLRERCEVLAAQDVVHTTTTTTEVGVPQPFTPPQVSGRATARPNSTRAAAGFEAVGSPGSPQSAALDASMLPGLWSAKLTITRPSSPTGAAQRPSRRSSAASSRASSARINRSSSLPSSSPHPTQSAAALVPGQGPVDPSAEGSCSSPPSSPPSSGAGAAAARRTSSAGLHQQGRCSTAAAADSGQSACLTETAKGAAETEASGSSNRRLRRGGGEGRAAAVHEAQVKQMESVIADLQQTVLQGCLERAQLQSQLSLLQMGTPAAASVLSPDLSNSGSLTKILGPDHLDLPAAQNSTDKPAALQPSNSMQVEAGLVLGAAEQPAAAAQPSGSDPREQSPGSMERFWQKASRQSFGRRSGSRQRGVRNSFPPGVIK